MPRVSEVKGCDGCPLRERYPDSTFVIPRLGNNSRLMIGDKPTEIEAEQGKPFIGTASKWLNVFYSKIGLSEKDNSAINVIQCRPPNDFFPTDKVARPNISEVEGHRIVEHCIQNHVTPFLKLRNWVRIDAFGDKPLKFILGKFSNVSYWRGSVLPVPGLNDAPIAVPTLDPKDIGKNQTMIPVVINDLKRSLKVDPENYDIYPSIENVRAFVATKFAFDIETDRWNDQAIQMVGLSAEAGRAIIIPFSGPYIAELQRIFAAATEVIGQNCIQFDLPILARDGVTIRGPKECKVWDIMLMHHLRFPVFPHDLEFIGKQFTNKGAWKADKASFQIYCARDVDVTFQSFEGLHHLLQQADLLDVYQYVSWPIAMICRYMTEQGVYLSGERIKQLRIDYLKKVAELEQLLPEELQPYTVTKRKRIKAPAGSVNAKGKPVRFLYEPYEKTIQPWRSPTIKLTYLYETLKLPIQFNLKSKNPTTDKNALDKLYTRHKLPVLRTLKELSKYDTLLSGFASEDLTRREILHPSFNPHGTETGRLSSSNPNIQNQPGSVRFMFISRFENGRIIAADFSGIENRITAFLANDRKRAEWLADPGFSEHKYLCSKFTGIPYAEVQKSHDKDSPYAMAKIVVHGSDRMMGSKKISEQFDMDFDEVKKLQSAWKTEIADTIRWQKRVSTEAQRTGWSTNPFKRKLWLWETNSATKAVSFFPQSTAADVIFRAMIGLMYERIGWPEDWAKRVTPLCIPLPDGAILFIQVHDELVIDCKPEVAKETVQILERVMTQPWPELNNLSLPIGKAEGASWGECGD